MKGLTERHWLAYSFLHNQQTDIGNNGIYTDNANWVQDLAFAWNASLYDFAYGGATCDNNIEQYVSTLGVSQQVADFISRDEGRSLNASESVYAIFVGINDANIYNGKLLSTFFQA